MLAFRAAQVILFSNDLPGAVAFYSRLGFTETFRVPADGDPTHVDLVLGGYKIGIATAASAREDHGLTPIAEGQRVAVVLWTDDTPSATRNSWPAEPLRWWHRTCFSAAC
jgi:catechol 2,3-dioxygenase-like lactoylglutathione lyase family enzyme